MKKLLVVAFFLFSMSPAFAAKAAYHGPAGCGLGSLIFKDQQGLGMNILAATFNASFGNQTFGMSTGTLGCEDAATAKVAGAAFIEGNKFALANDVARGGGETLDAYLQLIGAENADRARLQLNYSSIFGLAQSAEEIHSAFQFFVKS